MKNAARPLWLSACCLAAGMAAAAVFQPAPEAARPVDRPPQPERTALPAAAPAPTPTAEPVEEVAPEEGLRWVYGMCTARPDNYQFGKPKPRKVRERQRMISQIAEPEPIPPMHVRYAAISVYVPKEKPEDDADGHRNQPWHSFGDMMNEGMEVALDADAQEVLRELRHRFPRYRFGLDYGGAVTPGPDGSWDAERHGRCSEGGQVILAHDGAIFDFGRLATGKWAVQMEMDSRASWFIDGFLRGAGSASCRRSRRLLGHTYVACKVDGGVGVGVCPITHLFLVCFVPDRSGRGRPRVPEAVYLPHGTPEPWVVTGGGLANPDHNAPQPAGAPGSQAKP